jgi:hypothetical protein
MRRLSICLAALISPFVPHAQAPPPRNAAVVVIRPARVFDGTAAQEGWAVRVRGDRIEAAGPVGRRSVPKVRP